MIERQKTIGELYAKAKELEKTGYIRSYLERAIELQERILGIKHFGQPEIIIGMRHGKHKNGKIYLKYLDKKDLDHESGHWYLYELRNRLGVHSFVDDEDFDEDKPMTEWWQARNLLISEGVAEYFGRKMHGEDKNDDFSDYEYPNSIRDFFKNRFDFLLRLYYSGGYHLVAPILNKFGVEEGCKRIILNLPKKDDLVRLPEYRGRILSEPAIATSRPALSSVTEIIRSPAFAKASAGKLILG